MNPPGRPLRSRGLRGEAPTSTLSWPEKKGRQEGKRTYQRQNAKGQGLPWGCVVSPIRAARKSQ